MAEPVELPYSTVTGGVAWRIGHADGTYCLPRAGTVPALCCPV